LQHESDIFYMNKPTLLIGAIADYRVIGSHGFHMAGDKYMRAVTRAMGANPVILPAMATEIEAHTLLSRLDGLLLTGAYSNIEPHHYDEKNRETDPVRDPQRDNASFALIKAAIDLKLPILGLCRGFQELNVALGGSLHQQVQDVDGLKDHRENKADDLETQYGPAHLVCLVEGGYLQGCTQETGVMVNSLHAQGIKRLAPGLIIEAVAEDGLVEAYRLDDDSHFVLAVQWHPEWQVMENRFYQSVFKLFEQACDRHLAGRKTDNKAFKQESI
jgi:putative glutamine amidotransferase